MPADERELENFFLLMDPDWSPRPGEEAPPLEAVVGAWPLAADGSVGRFHSNPEYAPRDGDAVTDPVDAMLRLAMTERMRADQLQLMLRDAEFEVAFNGDGRPLVVKSPDDVRCVVVATGSAQVRRITSPGWQHVDLSGVVSLLQDGVDVLFNPGGPVPFRLTGEFLRETLIMTDEEAATAYAAFRTADAGPRVGIVPWLVGDAAAEVTVAAGGRGPVT
ncbi:hypothetical protein Asp14428_41880 [Actinoplanes sp. NBRC 14428]|nr:hypothetical protein Asp14428_41880 [Actinoplanes sp. NBRC 14428]